MTMKTAATTTDTPRRRHSADEIEPDRLAGWLDGDDALLVDVRDDSEYADERIDGALHVPLGTIDHAALARAAGDRKIVFQCQRGPRSKQAAERHAEEAGPAFYLEGGITAWRAAGRPTSGGGRRGMPIMRQVQIAAGSLVVIGVAMGFFLSPWFLALAAFVGCGLVFAGATGHCGMAMLLHRAPWNRPAG
jgi:rhodanese-related sulfurtransferase